MEHHHHGSRGQISTGDEHHVKHHHHAHGHTGQHDHSKMIDDFKKRFYISLILTIPVLLFSPLIQEFLGIEFTFPGISLGAAALATVIYFYGGWPFLKGLKDELASGGPGMMTLIAIAITVAWVYSTAVVLGLEGKRFFWELATLIDIMLLGHWLEMRSVMGASAALEKLAELMPSVAHRVHDDQIEEVAISELKQGDLILIKPGEKVPADGKIVLGATEMDESTLTGESKPVEKKKGDLVIGGSINTDGSIKVEVQASGEESYLNKVIKLVEEAQKSKSTTQNLADKAARALTYVAIGVGALTFITWASFSSQNIDFALERMVTVMIITCPHALGLAVPLVVAISTGLSAKNGLLIRNRTAFENSRNITAIVFDKTGTLTEGNFGISRTVMIDNSITESELLSITAAIEQNSEHPIARGIVVSAKENNLKIPQISDFKSERGKGVSAIVNGTTYQVVSPGYLIELGIPLPTGAGDQAETEVFVLKNRNLVGYFGLADKIRQESASAVNTLKHKGIKVLMATGDNERIANTVSEQLGLDGYYSQVLPHQKSELISELQKQGEVVAMTGDGVNDAPALAQADVGIAVGSGTDVAAETADIILTKSSPSDITNLILFGRATYNKMVQNLAWATGYNVLAIPLAAGVLFYKGIMIDPAVGAALMSLSTIICAANAQLLRFKFKPNH
jgi:Cu2+-exporting ATPase